MTISPFELKQGQEKWQSQRVSILVRDFPVFWVSIHNVLCYNCWLKGNIDDTKR